MLTVTLKPQMSSPYQKNLKMYINVNISGENSAVMITKKYRGT